MVCNTEIVVRISTMFYFAAGRPPRPRATVENTPRIPQPPSKGLAWEQVTVVINGTEWRLEVVRHERIHGTQGFWLCPMECQRPRLHLYWHKGQVGCRECLGLSYACKTTRNTAAMRARKLRRKLGGLPAPLGPLPLRRKRWRSDYWIRSLTKLMAIESALTARLGAMVERRRKRHDRRSNRGT